MEELLLGLDYEILQKGKTEIEFKGMEYDSRKIKDGDIFVALEGSISDGHKYIKQAIENGAKGVLVSKKVEPEFPVEYQMQVPFLFLRQAHTGTRYHSPFPWSHRYNIRLLLPANG